MSVLYYATSPNSNALAHHGILGMKWGVRRYQNKDGTLTKAGKKRYASGDSNARSKSISKMTDDELRTRVNRLQLEKTVMDLERQISAMTPKKVSAGKKIVNTIILPATSQAGKSVLTKWLEKVGSNALGLNQKESKNALQKLREEVDASNLKRRKVENDEWFESRKKQKTGVSSSSGSKTVDDAWSTSSESKAKSTGEKYYNSIDWSEYGPSNLSDSSMSSAENYTMYILEQKE